MERTSAVFAIIVVLAVATVLVVSSQTFVTGNPPPSYAMSAYSASENGLQLSLTINASSLAAGQPLNIRADESNTLSTRDNVSGADAWGVTGLVIGACHTSVYPFGVAVYHGDYSLGNISEATPLRIFPPVPCPLFIRLVTGYSFDPSSDMAVVLPGTGAPLQMKANVTVAGYYAVGSGNTSSPMTSEPFTPGIYTVVAGDEWGAMAILHFWVAEDV